MECDLVNLITYFLISVGVIIGVRLWILDIIKRDYPPGPIGLPFVGYIPFLGKLAHEKLYELGKKYGSVYTVKLGTTKVIVLNDWDAVKAGLVDQWQIFTQRPPIFVFDSTVNKRDVATGEGSVWKIQRGFFIRAMKYFTNNNSDREATIIDAAQALMNTLEQHNGKVILIDDQFYLAVLDIVWKIACNRIMSEDVEKGKEFFSIMKTAFANLGMDSPLNYFPFLRYVPGGGFGYWEHHANHEKLWNYLEQEVREHAETYKEGHYRDFIDIYLEEIKKREALSNNVPPFIMSHLVATLWDMFLGGTETTSGTLAWAFLYLALWPEVQLKIQSEIDDVIGRARLPCLQDQSRLPYLEAFIMETHRYASIAPLSFLHIASQNTTILGHNIPKNAVILQNIYGVHRDPKQWSDPDEFRPERFFDSNNQLKKPQSLIPFSIGARVCPGENIAKMQIFLVTSCLLQKYTFELPPNIPRPSLEPYVGLTLTPRPYSLLVKAR